MTLARLFPRWRAFSAYPDALWQTAFDVTDRGRLAALLPLIGEEQDRLVGQPGYFELCEAMTADVLALCEGLAEGEDPTDFHFLQFEVALGPLVNAQGAGDFGLTHDWIHNGLGNEVGHAVTRSIDPDRLDRFQAVADGWIRGRRGATITVWAATFFYYCRVRGILFEPAAAMIRPALAAITLRPLHEPGVIDALGMILNWATQYQLPIAKPLTDLLLPLFEEGEPLAQRIRIATLFATSAGVHSRQPPRFWAAWALANGAAHLNVHEQFQLIWQQIDTVEDWDRLKPQFLAAIAAFAAQFQVLGSPTAVLRATDQRAGLLKPAFNLMQRFERSADLLEMLAAWYGVLAEARLRDNVLFICPSFEQGTVYLGARTQLIERDAASSWSSSPARRTACSG